jgi:hypothetical protein
MEIRNSTNLVINGSWNLGILTPEWFIEEFYKKNSQEKIPVELDLGTNNIRFTIDDILIQPARDRLNLFAKKEENSVYESISNLADKVFNKLPYTPIKAVGHNCEIKLGKNDTFKNLEGWDLDQMQDLYKNKANSSAVNSVQIKHSIEYTNHLLNLTYSVGRSENLLGFNFHYDINLSTKAEEAIKEFPKNIEKAKKIANELIIKE